MAPATPGLRILSVGGNAVSAFLSWRLQATNACDVTLVWKSGFESVAQYGISIKSQALGNERFKPFAVVRTPEEAAQSSKIPYDYVLLCVKALPDVYDLATIIESVVTPQHTCILLNTTNNFGVEEYLERRYSTNVVLSLVCGAELVQAGPAEFEHKGNSADLWVGWANKNDNIPESIQKDMAEALAMTLSTANVSCLVSLNIRQQQLEKMIGPIAFHPASVLFNNPNLPQLYESPGVAAMINGIIDELLQLAKAYGCELPDDFRDKTIATMKASAQPESGASIMYQDYISRRPMEVETFLGSPLRLAKECGISLPRIEVVYALLHDRNQKNLKGNNSPGTSHSMPPPRLSSMAGNAQRPPMANGMLKHRGGGSRAPSMTGPPRRGPYTNGGYPPRMPNGSMNGYGTNGASQNHRNSMEGGDMEDFSHVMLYETVPDGGLQDGSSGSYGEATNGTGTPSSGELAIKERELQIRQREIDLREREAQMQMRRAPPPQHKPPPRQRAPPGSMYDDEDDGDDFFDPMSGSRPGMPMDDQIDMLSITSRRHRKMPSAGGMYHQPSSQRGSTTMFGRKNRASGRGVNDMSMPHDSMLDDPLTGYASNRYGTVDRQAMQAESRAGSITNARMDELARSNGGPYQGGPGPRRFTQSSGNMLSPTNQRPSPPNGYTNGMRGPSRGPPDGLGMRQAMTRHAPHHIEQAAGY